MLKSIVDPKVAYLGISFFIVLSSLCSLCASQSMAFFINMNDLDSVRTPAEFGRLITYMTSIAIILSLPFFYISGKCMMAKNLAEKTLKESSLDKVLESKKASAFIRSIGGGNLTHIGEMKPSTFSELLTMKALIKQKMSYHVDMQTKSSLMSDLRSSQMMNKSKGKSIGHSGMI